MESALLHTSAVSDGSKRSAALEFATATISCVVSRLWQIDSPGGYLDASFNLSDAIVQLSEHNIRTIAYVPKEAISGAAIISLGCDEIIMHPDAQIGDAGPIEMRPGHGFERAPEKVLSPMVAKLRDLAAKKHRPTALATARSGQALKANT